MGHDLDSLLMLITRSHLPIIGVQPRMMSAHDLHTCLRSLRIHAMINQKFDIRPGPDLLTA
jgi:hypothetical protein